MARSTVALLLTGLPRCLPDEEVKAVQVLYRAIQEHPQSYPLLHVQCDFLRNKVSRPEA